MMRWIIGSSLKARGFMLFAAALMIVMGVVQLRSVPERRSARVHAAHRRGADGGARALGERGRGAHHRAARAGPPERRGVPPHDPVGIAPRALVDRDGVRARHGHPGRPSGGGGAPHAGPRAAAGLETPADAAARLVDEPRDDGRAHLGRALPDRHVPARSLEHQAPTDGGSGRGQRVRLGPAGPAAAGAGRSRAAPRERRVPAADHRDDRERAVRLEPDLRRGVHPGHRRDHRDAEPAVRDPARCAVRLAGRPREGDRPGHRRRAAAPGRRGRHRREPSTADRRRRVLERARSAARDREAPRGEPAGRDARCRGGARRPAARALGDHDRHLALPARDLHRVVERQPHDRADHRCGAPVARPRRLPLRMEDRADRRRRDGDVDADRGPRAHLDPYDVQLDDRGRADPGARRRDRRRGGRRRERRATHASASRRRQRRLRSPRADRARRVHRDAQRRSVRPADLPRRARAGLLHPGCVRRVLPLDRGLLRGGRSGVDAGRPRGDAGARPDAARQGADRGPGVPDRSAGCGPGTSAVSRGCSGPRARRSSSRA